VTQNDPGPGVAVSTFAHEYPGGSRVPSHAHGADQLIYASRGVMEVTAGRRLWMIPPHFGLWIPASTVHHLRMPESVSMRTVYLRPALTRRPATCAVLHVAPFFRELIFEIVRVGRLRVRHREEGALRDLLVAQLNHASSLPTGVALPRDARADAVARAVLEGAALKTSLAALCFSAGVSVRTLQRAFRKEVGLDFETWRRHVRLMKAIELLVAGCSVKEAAFRVGYQESNGLVTLFRATFGQTPKAWMSAIERPTVASHRDLRTAGARLR
jgi:AraC family transcriptional regulator of arabinose operon